MAYAWHSLLDRLIAGEKASEDEHLWARAQIAAGRATPGQKGAYYAAQRPGWKLLDSLTSSLDIVEALLHNAPEHMLTFSPTPDEWSAQLIVGHLADNELVNAVRVRLVLTEDRPNLVGYDSDPWAKRFFSLDDTWTAFHRWTTVRRNLLRLCATISEEDWHRVGYLSYRGEESLRVLLGVLVGHDLAHIEQLETVLLAVRLLEGSERAVTSDEL